MDADQFSACQVVTILENELINDERLIATLGDKKQIYKLIGVAIQCVYYLIGAETNYWKTDNPLHYTHPPASTRVNMYLDVIRNQFGKDRDEDWIHIVRGVIRSQKCIYAYYGSDFCSPEEFVMDILKVDSHSRYLEAEWKKLKPIFATFTKFPF